MTTEPRLKSGCVGVVCVIDLIGWEVGGRSLDSPVVWSRWGRGTAGTGAACRRGCAAPASWSPARTGSAEETIHPSTDGSVHRGNPSERRYLDGDLELVQRADVLHQHGDDKLMRNTLKNKPIPIFFRLKYQLQLGSYCCSEVFVCVVVLTSL